MFPPFDQSAAFVLCQKVSHLLDEGSLRIEKRGELSSSRKQGGIMLGAMVSHRSGVGEARAFYTLSGVTHRIVGEVEGLSYVEPVVAPHLIEQALSPNDRQIHDLTRLIAALPLGAERSSLKARRKTLCDASLGKVFSLYRFSCAGGKTVSLDEICAQKATRPPAGTGECATVKLLHFAFSHGLTPTSLCEVFYEKGGSTPLECRPPCDSRCGFVLDAMLGLKVVWRDDHIIVVEKPAGLLSVPGRGEGKSDCVASRVRTLYPECIAQPAVHRLDMETSGLMVLAFTKEAHRALSLQFAEGQVEKSYEALLDGNLAKRGVKREGELELYFRLDLDRRPHQVWDPVYGKKAITRWRILGVERYSTPSGTMKHVSRVSFTPLTGRTHQIRLACSSCHGLACPIVGDSLYGNKDEGERLMLHATHLSFCHPITAQRLSFQSDCPF